MPVDGGRSLESIPNMRRGKIFAYFFVLQHTVS